MTFNELQKVMEDGSEWNIYNNITVTDFVYPTYVKCVIKQDGLKRYSNIMNAKVLFLSNSIIILNCNEDELLEFLNATAGKLPQVLWEQYFEYLK